MLPGMNPRMMKQAMKRMGISQEDIDASQVIIRCPDRDIIIEDPQVAKVNMGGQVTWQIMGHAQEKQREAQAAISISDDDVKTVMEQAGVSEETARAALENTQGDIAAAILDLQNNE